MPTASLPHHGLQNLVERRHIGLPGVVDAVVILQIGADLVIVPDDADAETVKQSGRADARQLQELRRVDRAARQDQLAAGARRHRAAVLQILDADGTLPFEQDFRRQRVRLDADIGALHRGPQEGARRRHAAPVPGVQLVDADAFLRGAVEILIHRQPGFGRRLHELFGQRMHASAIVGHVHRPAAPAIGVGAGLVVFDRLEIGQQVGKAPARIAEVAPAIIVGRMAPDPHHGIDRARAAEQLAARPVVGIAGKPRIRLGLVVPVHRGIEEGLAVAERHLHEEAQVAAAGLQHQHRMAAARRQPLGHDRACRAGTDDDEIIGLHRIS